MWGGWGGERGDVLSGGGGKDTFDFRAAGDSTPSAPDRILDFTPGEDTIRLARIDADPALAGDQAFTVVTQFTGHAGELTWFALDRAGAANDQTVIAADLTGDGTADVKMVLHGLVALTAGDFIL